MVRLANDQTSTAPSRTVGWNGVEYSRNCRRSIHSGFIWFIRVSESESSIGMSDSIDSEFSDVTRTWALYFL